VAIGGRHSQGLNNLVPSRDEALLYPQEIVYAQNGRFAVATHVGTSRPSEVTITLPDWTQNEAVFASLTLRGWQISQSSTSGEDENGNPVSVGGSYTFKKSGGAVTIIDDRPSAPTSRRKARRRSPQRDHCARTTRRSPCAARPASPARR
jgi:hypothetical protein